MLQLPLSENQTILGVINSTTSLGPSEPRRHISEEYHFCTRDLDLLYRFRTRTLLTLGSASYTHFYQNAYAKLVFSVRSVSYFIWSVSNQASTRSYCTLS